MLRHSRVSPFTVAVRLLKNRFGAGFHFLKSYGVCRAGARFYLRPDLIGWLVDGLIGWLIDGLVG